MNNRIVRMRQNGKACPFCRETMQIGTESEPTFEHLTPTSRGGARSGRNRVIVCARCNADKANLTIAEFRLVLLEIGDPRCEPVTVFMLRRDEAFDVRAPKDGAMAMRRARKRLTRRLRMTRPMAARNLPEIRVSC